ncbi:MAG: succinate dehydrogenase, cytochrome b556 subunit [Proteobacteria bacterium]|nr:succinate dehydrogenase, cytochrome b556 subunit [Pseudomonadota bacterium]
MATGERPLSPHLQVYRWQITMLLSITHRITGVGLSVGALVLTYWLAAAAYGPGAFERAQSFLNSWFGILLLLGWTFAIFFHLCNGIRHLFWDAGSGFEMSQVRASGWAVIIASVGLTVLVWAIGFGMMGGA